MVSTSSTKFVSPLGAGANLFKFGLCSSRKSSAPGGFGSPQKKTSHTHEYLVGIHAGEEEGDGDDVGHVAPLQVGLGW